MNILSSFLVCSLLYVMTFYYNDSWLGFLAENFVRESLKNCQNECSGCKDNVKSALLHLHCQLSLLEKLKRYFEQIRGELLQKIPLYYSQFEKRLPHSDSLDRDQNIYCGVARTFLITCTAETIYFGRYISELTDSYIAEAFDESVDKIKKKKSRDK